jgi:hypothetical protein
LPQTVGVGHRPNFAIAPSVGRNEAPALADRLNMEPVSTVQGVGSSEPEPVALVRGANVGSSQHCPATVIPDRGQVTEDSPKSPNKERWAVLHEHVSGSNVANDAGHVEPQSRPFAVDAGAPAGDADVLAGEAPRNHVNTASPRSPVKGANVIPDREGRENSVVLSGDKNACGPRVALDSADRAHARKLAAEDSSPGAGEQGEFAKAFISSREMSQDTVSSGQSVAEVASEGHGLLDSAFQAHEALLQIGAALAEPAARAGDDGVRRVAGQQRLGVAVDHEPLHPVDQVPQFRTHRFDLVKQGAFGLSVGGVLGKVGGSFDGLRFGHDEGSR